jgi:hypothetical protein
LATIQVGQSARAKYFRHYSYVASCVGGPEQSTTNA